MKHTSGFYRFGFLADIRAAGQHWPWNACGRYPVDEQLQRTSGGGQ